MEDNDFDPDSWWGPFYYNPNDNRLMVPKRFGWGWTINFAHTFSKLLIALAVIMALLFYIKSVISGRR